jgi:hypothetical protein
VSSGSQCIGIQIVSGSSSSGVVTSTGSPPARSIRITEVDDRFSLARMDLAGGQIELLAPLPAGTEIQPVTPQWADDGTVLISTSDGPVLLTLAPTP